MESRRAWLIWGTGVFAYLIAITQRTSFGVAGLDATVRFHATASALSAFTVLQLLVYAALQIPVGVMVDRFGPRVMVAAGAVLMFLGQLQLAAANSVPAGLIGRILVGAGDAMTFIAVLRLLPAWFSAAPDTAADPADRTAWPDRPADQCYPVCAGPARAGLEPGLPGCRRTVPAGVRARRDRAAQPASGRTPRCSAHRGCAILGRRWPGHGSSPEPGLGLWTHFTTQFSGTVFVMTWGYPFLLSGQGLDRGNGLRADEPVRAGRRWSAGRCWAGGWAGIRCVVPPWCC